MKTEDFADILYLKSGNADQVAAYETLSRYQIFELLSAFDPLLAGTVPIGLNVEGSDLDILCYAQEEEFFIAVLNSSFSQFRGFHMRQPNINGKRCIVAGFYADDWAIEIFGQDVPSRSQYGFRHLLIEAKILEEQGTSFRQELIKLRRSGYKTEPAFCSLLGLKGDPYSALLEYGCRFGI